METYNYREQKEIKVAETVMYEREQMVWTTEWLRKIKQMNESRISWRKNKITTITGNVAVAREPELNKNMKKKQGKQRRTN